MRTWIEKVLDEKLEDGLGALEFQKVLQSGVVLCQLANKIKKDVCKLPRSTSQPAVQRENISFYLKACEKLGMTDNFIFMTDNLFQESTKEREKDGVKGGWVGGRSLVTTSAPQERWGALDRASKSLGRTSERHMA